MGRLPRVSRGSPVGLPQVSSGSDGVCCGSACIGQRSASSRLLSAGPIFPGTGIYWKIKKIRNLVAVFVVVCLFYVPIITLIDPPHWFLLYFVRIHTLHSYIDGFFINFTDFGFSYFLFLHLFRYFICYYSFSSFLFIPNFTLHYLLDCLGVYSHSFFNLMVPFGTPYTVTLIIIKCPVYFTVPISISSFLSRL